MESLRDYSHIIFFVLCLVTTLTYIAYQGYDSSTAMSQKELLWVAFVGIYPVFFWAVAEIQLRGAVQKFSLFEKYHT